MVTSILHSEVNVLEVPQLTGGGTGLQTQGDG